MMGAQPLGMLKITLNKPMNQTVKLWPNPINRIGQVVLKTVHVIPLHVTTPTINSRLTD